MSYQSISVKKRLKTSLFYKPAMRRVILSFLSEIQRTFHLFDGLAFYRMSIYHGRPDIAVSQHFLNGADIVIRLQKMRCKTVAKGVRSGSLREFCPPDSFVKRFLNVRLMKMIPSKLLLIQNRRKRLLRKEPLPYEILCGCGIFLFEQVADKQLHTFRLEIRKHVMLSRKLSNIQNGILSNCVSILKT